MTLLCYDADEEWKEAGLSEERAPVYILLLGLTPDASTGLHAEGWGPYDYSVILCRGCRFTTAFWYGCYRSTAFISLR